MKAWLLGLLLVVSSLPVQALDAPQVLALAKKAAGGDAWDDVRNIYLKGKAKIAGFDTDREEWVDLLKIRYAQKFQAGFLSGGLGFDGATAWGKSPNQEPNLATDGQFYQNQRSNACRKSLTYWYPKRCDAKLEYKGKQTDDGQSFQVIEVSPKDALSFELWFDSETYLLARVRNEGGKTFLTLDDYRTVNGLKYPFRSKSGDQEAKIEEVQFNIPITNERYAPPAAKAKNNRKG